MQPNLILASGSSGRRALLDRLKLDYRIVPPDIDESPRPGETPPELVARLARAKAETVFAVHPEAVVIGSDQVADLHGDILGKPSEPERAKAQLRRMSGQTVVFRTGVCVLAPACAPEVAVVDVETRFRALTDAEIERYVAAEDVTDTAGSIKSEALGITLVESIRSDDPTTLIGLPLITLRRMLAAAGIALP